MMDNSDLSATLLAHVNHPDYRPVKPRVIAKQLGLDEDSLRALKKTVKQLVKQGKLAYGSGHLVFPVATTKKKDTAKARDGKAATKTASKSHGPNQLVGVFRRTSVGHGFVRPSGASADVDHRKTDIYIPADRTLDAATGDTVLVRLSKHRDVRRTNPLGEIVEIIERETHQFVGTYFESAGNAYVQVDGRVFAAPILVGDPGAKNAQPDDKVVFEMVRFPTQFHDGEGVITEVLGPRGEPGVDTLSIIREYNLPEEFPDDAQDEARAQAHKFDESLDGRLDLTAETIITIDPIDARDFDDAISLSRLENGHWRLGVHIADVSHFVPEDTALDREAHARATSVYLPDRVLPMLPEIISNNLASLQPHKVRYTKSVFIEFTAEGVFVDAEAHNAAIRSARRFAYGEVDEYLADRDAWRSKLSPKVHQLLADMHELAMTLRARRFRRGALELDMKEVKVDLDKNGKVTGAHVVVNTESHQMIEEFMLAANEAIAEMLQKAEYHFLRRVHASPDPRKLQALTEFATELGFQTESLESRFELQRLLKAVQGRPEQHAVNYAVLRSLQRAVYSPEVEGHYALASDTYCHFTSPIRRYPDLTVHRLLNAILKRKKAVNDLAELVVLGEHCSDRERRAEAAERELTKLKLMIYLSDRIGQEMDAVVTGVEEFGLFVQGVQLPAEGLVHVTTLADDYYHYDRRAHTLTGRRAGNTFRLGDLVRVEVARVDVDRRELDFRIVERKRRSSLAKPGRDGRARKDTKRGAKAGRKGAHDATRGARGKRRRR
jgi:ribonuclease R